MSVCLPVCQLCLGTFEMNTFEQQGFFIGSTVRGHDGKSVRNVYFFCPAQSSEWWLLFETWLPFLQDQWKGLSRRLSYCLVFRFSFSTSFPLSPSHSERLVVLSRLFNKQNRWRNSPLWRRHGQFSWTDWSVHKRHTSTVTLHQDTTYTRTHARPCVALHLYAGKWTLYWTLSVR